MRQKIETYYIAQEIWDGKKSLVHGFALSYRKHAKRTNLKDLGYLWLLKFQVKIWWKEFIKK